MVLQSGEHLSEMVVVLLWIQPSYQDVIKVGIAKGQAVEDMVNEPLEGLSCVPQTKGHLHKLEEAKGGGNCCLGDALGCYRDLVVSPDQVNFLKGHATMKVGGEILQMRDRVAVRDSSSVHSAVIPTWSPVTRGFLWNHVEG